MRAARPQRTRRPWRWTAALGSLALLGVGALMWAAVIGSPQVAAANFSVNVTTDDPDLAIDGNCDSLPAGGPQCSLRAAIQEANASGAADAIAIAVPGPIVLTGSLPAITDDDLVITGSGQEVDLTAAGVAFIINADRVQISNLIIDGGGAGSTGIRLAGAADDATLTNLTVRGFTADGIFQIGSGARNTVQNSTITLNGDDGIDWSGGIDARILDNMVTNNTNDGLETGAADGMLVQGNTFSGNSANQINILSLAAGEDIDIFQNNIISSSNGIRISAGVTGGDIAIGLTVPNRNVFRGALAPGEFHVLNGSTQNINAENNDWDAYSLGAIEGVVCHTLPDSDANCVGEGTGIVDFDPFIGSPMPLATPTPTVTPTSPATATATATATPTGPTPTPTAGPQETISLVAGCQIVTPTEDLTTTVLRTRFSPVYRSAWLLIAVSGTWLGDSPAHGGPMAGPNDLPGVDRLEGFFACMPTGGGTFTRAQI